ncbi:MAG: Lrp/AsnC family transcriptional regulator [Candidatus Omnitrophica bacterium]|nr:Lrp/AsnC family transcriptional regulator [Candidatus Omnitrophota bacterium]
MLTAKDKIFLKGLQTDFPLDARPFGLLAGQAGLSEEKMLAYFRKFERQGLIRYIAPMFDLRKLGVVSTLIAMRVPVGQLDQVVRIINACPNVSHNYLRDGDYNVWFTLSAASERKLKAILTRIRKESGVEDMLDLRTERVFKSQAIFELR